PNHPVVIINQYYDPLVGDTDCLQDDGLSEAKKQTLRADLSALNDLLEQAADTARFRVAKPDFDGHGLCSDQPYVQGLDDPAPFHPTASGQLAIALADEQALHAGPR